jgi:hypothetical protein
MTKQSLRCISPPAASRRGCPGGTRWLAAGKEPALADMLADPMVALVMRRDGVSPAQLRAVVATAQGKLHHRLCCRFST